jgi:hypothetical protein
MRRISRATRAVALSFAAIIADRRDGKTVVTEPAPAH